MICIECGEEVFGDTCKECGLVYNDRPIDFSPIARKKEKAAEDRYKSFIRPESPHISNMTIHSNRTTNKELKRAFRRENMSVNFNNKSEKYDRRYIQCANDIRRIVSTLKLHQGVFEEAVNILRVLIDNEIRLYDSYNPACVKIACRIRNIPATFKEIAKVCVDSEKKIKRNYVKLVNALKIKIKPETVYDSVNYFLNKMRLNNNLKKQIRTYASNIKNISGKRVNGYAAAIIYIFLKKEKTQAEIAEICGVTPMTLMNRKKEIEKT